MGDFVTVVEVGARDGLQNESRSLPAETRVEMIERLAASGLPVIEAGSFVSPKWVPQMANSESVLAGLGASPGTRYPVLVPNLQGLERALAAGAREIAVFAAASETFSQRNTNCSIADSITRLSPVVRGAQQAGLPVRGYVSCVLGCPWEGEIAPAAVTAVGQQLVDLGCHELSLGDTIGTGTPRRARQLLETIGRKVPFKQLAVHFHDTYGQALANVLACLEAGVRTVDASVSGLGGCPYARGASGNLATEDLVYMLHGLGFETGIDLQALALVGDWISGTLNRPNNSRAGVAIVNRIQTS